MAAILDIESAVLYNLEVYYAQILNIKFQLNTTSGSGEEVIFRFS